MSVFLDVMFPFYCDNYLVWAMVCKEWRAYILERTKGRAVTKIFHIWDNKTIFEWARPRKDLLINKDNIGMFIKSAHIEVIKLCLVDSPVTKYRVVIFYAIRHNRLDLLRVINPNFYHSFDYVLAVQNENIPIMEFLYANNCMCDSYTFTMAVKTKNMKIINWLHEHNCSKSYEAYLFALVDSIDFKLLDFLFEIGFPLHPQLYVFAIARNIDDFFLWLYRKKCPWDESVRDMAIQMNQHEIAQIFTAT